MSITPWELYWILKLDDVRNMLFLISFISFIIAFAVGCAWFAEAVNLSPRKEVARTVRRIIITLVISMSLSLLAASFIPTTMQMAVIKVAPMIVDTECVQKELPAEARELYGLLKQYLKANINKEVEE